MKHSDYRSQPSRTAHDHPPTLFLHGFLGRGGDWNEISSDVTGAAISPDLPGHGDCLGLPKSTYTMEGAADHILRTLDGAGIRKCSIVGYSMGGRLALYLALRFPERFASLVLESSSPGLETNTERAARRESDENLARRLEAADEAEFRGFLEEWHRQPLFASLADYEGLVERLISDRIYNDPKELAKSLRGMGTGVQPPLWGELPNLRVPTLAVVGEYDAKFRRIAGEMSGLSPNIPVEVVGGAGHNVHIERPEEFVALAGSFISRAVGG